MEELREVGGRFHHHQQRNMPDKTGGRKKIPAVWEELRGRTGDAEPELRGLGECVARCKVEETPRPGRERSGWIVGV